MYKLSLTVVVKLSIFDFPTAVNPDTCNIQDANDSADLKSARHGQFQEKRKNSGYWFEYFHFENFLNRKITTKFRSSTRPYCTHFITKQWKLRKRNLFDINVAQFQL